MKTMFAWRSHCLVLRLEVVKADRAGDVKLLIKVVVYLHPLIQSTFQILFNLVSKSINLGLPTLCMIPLTRCSVSPVHTDIFDLNRVLGIYLLQFKIPVAIQTGIHKNFPIQHQAIVVVYAVIVTLAVAGHVH